MIRATKARVPHESRKVTSKGAGFLFAVILIAAAAIHAAPPELIDYPPTYRTFDGKYAKVWNAVVRLVVVDMHYPVQAADPEFGFLSTRWKTKAGNGNSHDFRTRLHINVKKAAAGTLVTVRCEIEERIPIAGTDKGRWMKMPSDHSCEARFLDRLEAKLK